MTGHVAPEYPAITPWLQYAGQQLASIRRSRSGSNMPVGDSQRASPMTWLSGQPPVRSVGCCAGFRLPGERISSETMFTYWSLQIEINQTPTLC
jgi:hypothetical protein